MNNTHEAVMEMLLTLFEAEAERLHVDFDRRKWSKGREMGIPQQGNCSDCGVFLCAFASHVVDATKISHSPSRTWTQSAPESHTNSCTASKRWGVGYSTLSGRAEK